MKQFTTIEKLDTGIVYLLELASSLSVLLLAFGLMASMCGFSCAKKAQEYLWLGLDKNKVCALRRRGCIRKRCLKVWLVLRSARLGY